MAGTRQDQVHLPLGTREDLEPRRIATAVGTGTLQRFTGLLPNYCNALCEKVEVVGEENHVVNVGQLGNSFQKHGTMRSCEHHAPRGGKRTHGAVHPKRVAERHTRGDRCAPNDVEYPYRRARCYSE